LKGFLYFLFNYFRLSKLYETASYMYILPPYRFTVYAIGIALGYLLRIYKNVRLSNKQLTIGWIVVTAGFLGTLLMSGLMSVYNYKFSSLHAAFYSAVAPIPWCLFFAWIVYTSQLGYKSESVGSVKVTKRSFINFRFADKFVNFFEWRGFLVSTKLSYGIYLVQFAVFHYNIGKVRTSSHFGIIKSVVRLIFTA
jgi:hypothetical protein